MKKQRGFTLTELMVGLSVAGITMTVGIPSFSEFVANQSQTVFVNELVTAMTLARSEAIKENRFVTVCASVDGLSCSAQSANWKDGWIVFSNTNQANADTVDVGENVLYTFDSGRQKRTVDVDVAGLDFIAFRPSGTPTVSVNWVFCDKRGAISARGVSVDRAGRARVFHADPDDPQNPMNGCSADGGGGGGGGGI